MLCCLILLPADYLVVMSAFYAQWSLLALLYIKSFYILCFYYLQKYKINYIRQEL